ncbi:5-oxoprolinase subunit PxpB [Dyella amyloliquefaciens]|uniref:5-oxoprolinase subunit PxpB n=1 Tax=Dyella amyloliquefaciens TaxID=1770545 RepID=UPI001E39DA0D|nr:5-oxoprolinase subunit PxpB [Dyella amyloliquefaciens]
MNSDITWEALAEDALLLRFGETIDPATNARVHAARRQVQARWPDIECVPAYASLLLRFDPAQWSGSSPHRQLHDAVRTLLDDTSESNDIGREVIVPVLYGGEFGPDLADVARHAGMSEHEAIARHGAGTYRVAMLGFAPGFPYLLGLDPMLAMPRRADPRLSVAAGSVAIGGLQTGIYPQTLPGGWQLIGRTPLSLFALRDASPSLLQPGDRVRFRAIEQREYEQLAITGQR